MNKTVGFIVALMLSAFAAIAIAASSPQPAPVATQCCPHTCKKIQVQECSSCAEPRMDNECKPGVDYASCNQSVHVCTNGAECDVASAHGTCGS